MTRLLRRLWCLVRHFGHAYGPPEREQEVLGAAYTHGYSSDYVQTAPRCLRCGAKG